MAPSLSVIVCGRNALKGISHREHIQQSIGCSHEYIFIDNTTNHLSLTAAYNSGVEKASGEICVFVHDDVFFVYADWGNVLLDKFKHSSEIGGIGVAGTSYLLKSNPAWPNAGQPYLFGKVIHQMQDKRIVLTQFSAQDGDREVVAFDGLFFAIKRSLFSTISFDSSTFDGFHFYDLDICMQIRKTHKLLVTTDILTKHLSGGNFNSSWEKYKHKFMEKYAQLLPITCSNKSPEDLPLQKETFQSIELKNFLNVNIYNALENLGNPQSNTLRISQPIQNQLSHDFHKQGIIAFQHYKFADAETLLEKATNLFPTNAQYLYNYALTLYELGKFSPSLSAFHKVLMILPDHVPSLLYCATILCRIGQPSTGEECVSMVIKLHPNNAEAFHILGHCRKDQGNCNGALQAYEQAINLEPKNMFMISNYLLCLCYLPAIDAPILFKQHVAFQNIYKNILRETYHSPPKFYPRYKQLCIGYVSGDFRNHSVAYFIENILKHHNKQTFKIICYSNTSSPDEITRRIQQHPTFFRDVVSLSCQELHDLIISDGVDILVDLSGHTAYNRLDIFAHRSAPIQVSYLGYPCTTGLTTMDYRFTDEYVDPTDTHQWYTEKLIQLPHGFLCYAPPHPNIPQSDSTPAVANGYITFGSAHGIQKLNESILSLWATILQQIPTARINLKATSLSDPRVIDKYITFFSKYAISDNRIIFSERSKSTNDHLVWYNSIDIALDAFPYNGTTTTFEALFMGVAVISLCGTLPHSRVGYSILSRLGLKNCIAFTEEEYVIRACRLSDSLDTLNTYRTNLRKQVLNSHLCNAPLITKSIEQSYEHMFQQKEIIKK